MRQAFFLTAFPPLVSALFLGAGLALFSGCYTLKQGTIMLSYLGKAVPLAELAGDSVFSGNRDSETRAFAERAADIRRFAQEELGLSESKNYTRYVEIDRDYLAAVVSASAADSFTRHEWRFPVVGAVPYKGFFNPADARKEGERLKKQGLDVWIRGVDAFSTLGWFRDPLYSYMKDYSVYRLADLIIHELFHATVFIRGEVQFNEQLAEWTGTQGARLYMESRFGKDSEEWKAIDSRSADFRAFRDFIRGLCAELETAYAGPGSREEKLAEKDRIIKAAQARFSAEYESRFTGGDYRGFAELPVNNAYLDLYRLYYEEDSFLSGLYRRIPGEDSVEKLKSLVDAAKAIKPKTKNPGADLERILFMQTDW